MSLPQGPTGPTGMTGRRGLQGTPYGAPGTAFYSTSGRVSFSNQDSSTMTAAVGDYGITYLLRSSDTYITVTLPTSMSSTHVGAFWVFRNTYTETKSLTFSTGEGTPPAIVYNGVSDAQNVNLAPGNAIALIYTGTANNYISF